MVPIVVCIGLIMALLFQVISTLTSAGNEVLRASDRYDIKCACADGTGSGYLIEYLGSDRLCSRRRYQIHTYMKHFNRSQFNTFEFSSHGGVNSYTKLVCTGPVQKLHI